MFEGSREGNLARKKGNGKGRDGTKGTDGSEEGKGEN